MQTYLQALREELHVAEALQVDQVTLAVGSRLHLQCTEIWHS